MVNLRSQILKQMKKRGIASGYALARRLEGKITQPAIDGLLKGRSQMKSDNIELILNFLGGEIRFKK
jgi:hypothetical protein